MKERKKEGKISKKNFKENYNRLHEWTILKRWKKENRRKGKLKEKAEKKKKEEK